MSQKHHLLALNRIPNIGPKTVQKLLSIWPDLGDLFSERLDGLIEKGLRPSLAKVIHAFDKAHIQHDVRWGEQPNHQIITWDDPAYPDLLKETYDPPPVLFAVGDISLLHSHNLAVVGSRGPSATGIDNAHRFSQELAAAGLTIVSGLARGIDAQAHKGALAKTGKTIAVMATGMDRIYPSSHRGLALAIAQSGLILTEFPIGVAAKAGHFPRRNRIISGLSLATLVIEAAIKSGSLITARLALEQNRDVFAIPGSLRNPKARGCNHLLQQGAALVTCAEDVLKQLSLPISLQTDKQVELVPSVNETPLLSFIDDTVTSIESIVQHSGIALESLLPVLADLEIEGMIESVPGGYIRRYS